MGYYANYNGGIKLKETPPDELIKKFSETFENFDHYDNMFDFGGYDKYYDDSVIELLELIAPYTLSGSIEYHGEDDCMWRFIFIDGKWKEQNGRVVYDEDLIENKINLNTQGEFLGQIIDIFDDVIDPNNAVFKGRTYDKVMTKLYCLMKGWRVF